MNVPKKINGKIEFLRFLFAVIIVIHHSRSFLGDDIAPFLGGSLAVEFFFFVSGYLMMATIERKNCAGKPEYIGKETAQYVLKKWGSVLPESIISWMLGFMILNLAQKRPLKDMVVRLIDGIWEPFFVTMTGLGQGGINGVVWYISAMLLCMAILYPLLRKYHDVTIHLIIPIVSLCIFGYFFKNFSTPRGPTNWIGWTYKGVPRAFAELGIGCLLYYFAEKIRSYDYTCLGKCLITLTENTLYLIVVYFMYLMGANNHDYFFIALLAIAVALTFSGSGIDSTMFNNRTILWLGRFSVPLYFGHTFWASALNHIVPVAYGITLRLGIYLGLASVTALVVMQLAKQIRTHSLECCDKIKTLVVRISEKQ